ncbi:hypothetical protein HanPI659440_Chr16g0621341 [Helianthus annuus]|nr:hypothetical protein HanPI659440_Chr16g0621341 [Helianthus annuus]
MIILLTRMHHFITTENISYKRMAPTLLSPATVNHHHHHHHRLSILTAITPFVPSVHCSCSTSRITSSHCWSPLPPRNSRLRRCRAASPHPPSPPESEPPPGDDQSSSSVRLSCQRGSGGVVGEKLGVLVTQVRLPHSPLFSAASR